MDNGHPTRRRLLWLRRHSGLLAIVLVALAYAQPIQALGWNQTSHYALVRALAHGHTDIDPYKDTTGDKAKDPNGHWYSSRAPGLAFYMVPAYKVMTLVGVDNITHKEIAGKHNDEMIWALGLWATVLPAALMLLLVRWLADKLEPGYGTAAAVALGLGTLMLPFATLLFSHVFSALLGFAAFAILWRERERGSPAPRVLFSGLAGLLIGYGFTTEYPLFIVGAVLGVYILATFMQDRVKHAAAYIGGGVLGIVPLMLYDKAAFGSFFHVAYADLPKHHRGFFGINLPNPKVAVELLFTSRGLLTLAPILVLSLVGTWWMYRRGRRAEALVIAAVFVLFLVYNSGYYLPYGGQVPGPRFLITTLPFLGVPVALAFRRVPGPALALAAASTVCLTVPTLVKPFVSAEGDTGRWMRQFESHNFQAQIATAAGAWRWGSLIPFAVFVIGGVILASLATPRMRLGLRSVAAGLAAVAVWAPLAIFAPRVLGIDHQAELRIVAAGDPTAVHEKFGSHPISRLVLLAVLVTIAFMLIAWLVSWWTGRRARDDTAEWAPAVRTPPREPTAAAT
ncbi:MAG: hypothetical protein ACJ77M_19490 [Thermoleophilaceae bacterium]